jgi:DNA-binding GntR family transcriptional regulator
MPLRAHTPPDPKTAVDAIVDHLEEAIITGRLPAGSRLAEHELAASLGVSRGPLREALQQLEDCKLIQRTTHAGCHVVALSLTDLGELVAVREVLEGLACRQAAANMPQAQIRELRKIIRRRAAQPDTEPNDTLVHAEHQDDDLHYQILLGSGNQYLIHLLGTDLYHLLRMYRYRSSTVPERKRAGVVEHSAIVDAIEARDCDRAERLMREHLREHAAAVLAQYRANEGEGHRRARMPDGETPASPPPAGAEGETPRRRSSSAALPRAAPRKPTR